MLNVILEGGFWVPLLFYCLLVTVLECSLPFWLNLNVLHFGSPSYTQCKALWLEICYINTFLLSLKSSLTFFFLFWLKSIFYTLNSNFLAQLGWEKSGMKSQDPSPLTSGCQSNQYQPSIFHIFYFSSHFQLEASKLISASLAGTCFPSRSLGRTCGTQEWPDMWLLTKGNRVCTT